MRGVIPKFQYLLCIIGEFSIPHERLFRELQVPARKMIGSSSAWREIRWLVERIVTQHRVTSGGSDELEGSTSEASGSACDAMQREAGVLTCSYAC